MRHSIVVVALILALTACNQSPFTPPLDPTGSWSGSWTGPVADTNLYASFTRTSSGWQGIFSSNNVDIVAICSNPDDEGPSYLYCGAWSSVDVIVWEGDVIG